MSVRITLTVDLPGPDEEIGRAAVEFPESEVEPAEVGSILLGALDEYVCRSMLADMETADPLMNGDLRQRLARLEARTYLLHLFTHLPDDVLSRPNLG